MPLVIGGSVRRPVRFVMDHNIFKIPVLSFIFRTARAIPIAPAREDSAALQKAFDRIDAELADGEVVCIFPEGKLTRSGEMNEFKRGVEKILERRPVPVIPMALRGLWGSFFSHRGGKAAMTQMPRRFWSTIEVVVTAPVPGDDASATGLQKIVAGLRGEWQYRATSLKVDVFGSVWRMDDTRRAQRARRAPLGPQARAASHAPRTSRADAAFARRRCRRHPARRSHSMPACSRAAGSTRRPCSSRSRATPPTSAPRPGWCAGCTPRT